MMRCNATGTAAILWLQKSRVMFEMMEALDLNGIFIKLASETAFTFSSFFFFHIPLDNYKHTVIVSLCISKSCRIQT